MASLSDTGQRARRRIFGRLMPYLFVLYIIAYLDRINVGFAALEMTKALRFSDSVFGFGAGVFFIGYFVLEIPGAVIVERWSARLWIARIMITWGIITALTAFVHTPMQFYGARFLLGAAEAGFFPGLIVYLTHWFRTEDRAKAVALLMSAVPLSNFLGSPISGKLLGVHWFGMEGWRWLFIVEGFPAVVFGFLTIWWLTDWPKQAKWLPQDEEQWLTAELEREKQAKRAVHAPSVLQALAHRDVLLLCGVYFLAVTANYGYTFWLPTILKRASGLPNFTVTVISIVPFFVGWVCMMINGWHSDIHHERRWHVSIPHFIAGCGLAGVAVAAGMDANIYVIVAFFCVTAAGINGYLPAFWALATAALSESAGAAAIGMINSIGNLGGFAGPFVMGYLRTHTSSFASGIGVLAAAVFCSSALTLLVRHHKTHGE